MTIEAFADEVGILKAAKWAAQQPKHLVATHRPSLRRAIESAAASEARFRQPGQLPSRYTWRTWPIESSRGPWGELFSTGLRWSHHFGFVIDSKTSSLYCRNSSREASVGEVFQAISDMESALRRLANDIAARATKFQPVQTGEYDSLRDKFESAVNTAYAHFGLTYYAMMARP